MIERVKSVLLGCAMAQLAAVITPKPKKIDLGDARLGARG